MFPVPLKIAQVEHLKLLRIRLWGCIIGLLVIGPKREGLKGPTSGEPKEPHEPESFNPMELEQAFSGAFRSY